MNRRKFLKFLGKATVASGVAVISGLPEANEMVDNPNVPIEFEGGCLWSGENNFNMTINTPTISEKMLREFERMTNFISF